MQELHWNNKQGLRIQASHWQAESPKAVITLVHGLGEHVGRYGHMARWYNTKGVAVLGYDHQGFGKSEGKRGHAKSLDVFLDDLGQALEETATRYPGIPHFLYGHSMGGLLVLNYLLRRQPKLSGVIATGPWIRLAFPAPFVKVIAGRLLHRLVPALRLPNGLDSSLISHDPAIVNAYKKDALVHDQLSVAAGIQLLNASIWLNQYDLDTPVPLLLQHGGDDKITSAPATQEFADRVQGDVSHKEWPGLYHEIHNEPEKEDVFSFTWDWMEALVNR